MNVEKINYLSRLKELRKESGKSLSQFSNCLKNNGLEITPDALRKYECGIREPNISTLIKLADYFNVSIDYLVGRSDKRG